MKSAIKLVVGLLLALGVAPAPQGAAQAVQSAAAVPFKTEEIDQLMAPIALYPDELLAQMLTAATYPLEIVMAARWVADPKNAALKGDALNKALLVQAWDPSVKSLVAFPAVLKMMSDQLDWTQKLGDAFLANQQDCLASVQRLRQRSQSAGKLTSDVRYTGWDRFGTTRYARQILLSRPADDYQLQLGITKLTVNEPIAADRFELHQPPGTELVRVGEGTREPGP